MALHPIFQDILEVFGFPQPRPLTVEAVKARFPRWEHISFEYGRWIATHENYDCDYNDEDGFVGNGWLAEGRTLEDLVDEMECIEAEKAS